MIQNLTKLLLAELFYLRTRIVLRKKIKGILGNITIDSSLTNSQKKQYLHYWGKLDKNVNFDWFRAYSSINGIFDIRYVSEIAYYNIFEPTLNNAIFAEAYSDKNNYHRFIANDYLPKVLLRCIQGAFLDEQYKNIHEVEKYFESILINNEVIVCKKTIETGGGADVEILKKSEGVFVDKDNHTVGIVNLKSRLGSSFLIQEYIEQHSFFKQFNPSSVNTIRVFTYRSVVDNQIHILHSVFRIGKKGALVDNQASGGICCGVNINTGLLNSFAVDKYGKKCNISNNIAFANQMVPNYHDMKDIAKEIAHMFPYHRLLGFDFAVDINGIVRLVEINNRNNEINFYQMNNGSLFGDHTDEIVEYCLENKKVFKIDYEV